MRREGDGFDVGFDVAGVLVALGGFGFECAEDDFVEADVDLDFSARGGEAAEGEFAGEEFVEDDAEGVDVGTVVDGTAAGDLFGSHVVGGAHGLACAGERAGGGAAGLRLFETEELGESEVGDFYPSAIIEQDILGFDVAMDDPFVVGELEGVADLADDFECLLRVGRAICDHLPEGWAFDVLHEEVVEAAGGLTEVENADDVGVVQPGEGTGFAEEAFGEGGVVGEIGGEDFDGDGAIEPDLFGEIDGSHTSGTEKLNEFQVGELGCEFVDGRRNEATISGYAMRRAKLALLAESVGEEAAWAEACRGVGR